MTRMAGEDSDAAFLRAAMQTMLEASDEGFIVLDGGGRCRMIGRRAGEMFGVEPAAYVAKQGAEVLEAFARACDEPDTFWRAAAAPLGAPAAATQVDVRRPLARTVLCRAIAMTREPSHDSSRDASAPETRDPPDGRWLGRIVFVRDVTLERAAETSSRQLGARLRALTPFDALTGLLNQRRLYEELGREHSRAARAWDSFTLLRVDVDGMTAINHLFGVPVGDQILEQVARRLETCVREYDVLARLDGDEFGALLPGADGVAARAVGARMARAVGVEAFALGPAYAGGVATLRMGAPGVPGATPSGPPPARSERVVTVSIGGALWMPPSRQSAETMFRRAGEALSEARRQGGGQVCLYEAS
jgi:diguanylate cyclase (GGDEF)-like protein